MSARDVIGLAIARRDCSDEADARCVIDCIARGACHCTETADAILAALAAAGFKVLAREPTTEMLEAGYSGSGEDSYGVAKGVWFAMWDAAPSTTPKEPAPKPTETFGTAPIFTATFPKPRSE